MNLSLDVKCAITTAIVSVLVYMLILNIMGRYPSMSEGLGKEMTESNTFRSMEFLMLVAVFIGYNLNYRLFDACKAL